MLKLSPGDLVAGEGTEGREVYIILDGLFEVFDRQRRICLLEPGDLFGEIAFFSEQGERTASVKALTTGEVLVLRRKFLRELNQEDPAAGFQILLNMGRLLSQKVVTLTSELDEATRQLRSTE